MKIQSAVKMMKAVFEDMDEDFTVWEYREEIKELLKCGVFVAHIEQHLYEPFLKVKCKICDKTIDEITKDTMNKSQIKIKSSSGVSC